MSQSEAAPPTVAAIVLNYNGKDVTLEALASLTAMDYPTFDLIVVDNGSSDGSYEAIEAAFPSVTQLRTEENLGAAGGLNLGICHAVEEGYDYLLLLNNDIEVEPDLLTHLVARAEADPAIGCVGPKAYYYWDRQRIWSAGGRLRFRESITREIGEGEIDHGQYDEDGERDYLNGCCMLVRREAMEKTGLWDPLFHLAVEDADWCWRLRRHGYRIAYAHRAVLYHMVSHATGVYRPGKTYHTGRSTALFVRRYANLGQWLTFLVFITLAIPVAFLRELPKGNQRAALSKLRGVVDGLRATMTVPPTCPISGNVGRSKSAPPGRP